MNEFHLSGYGQRFFNGQLPDLIKSLDRIGRALEAKPIEEKHKFLSFDKQISKVTAMELIFPRAGSYLAAEIGIEVMCKEYGEDSDWVALDADDYEVVSTSPEYKTFEIWK